MQKDMRAAGEIFNDDALFREAIEKLQQEHKQEKQKN